MSTFFTTVRLFLALTALNIATPMAQAQSSTTTPPCEVLSIDARSFQINMNGQIITIIGWQHPGLEAEQAVANTYKTSLNFAKNRQCLEAEGTLNLNLQSLKDLDSEAQRVHEILKQNSTNISEVGTERAFEETSNVRTLSERAQEYVRATHSLCPNTNIPLQKTFNIYPGPENLFALESKLPVIGVEDGALVKKSESLIPQELKQIDIFQLPISDSVKAQIRQAKPSFETVTRDQFQKILDQVPNSEHRRLILLYRNTIVALRAQVKERNTAMINRIIAGKKNHALVVGQDHLSDLAKQLKNRCLNEKPQDPIESLAPTPDDLPILETNP